jgi:predicted component of type VI protein secretion system
MARYAIRLETADGTLEDAAHTVVRKADAIRFARNWSKTCACSDVVRIHVDDTTTEVGIAAFGVAQ